MSGYPNFLQVIEEMNTHFGILRCDRSCPGRRELIFQTALIAEAAYKMAKLSDLAPSNLRYQLVRLPVQHNN
jgi:hypothetical protein